MDLSNHGDPRKGVERKRRKDLRRSCSILPEGRAGEKSTRDYRFSIVSELRHDLNEFKSIVQNIAENVRKSTSFGGALFLSFLTAILTPIILGLIIVGIRAFDLWPTPAQVEEFFYREKGKTGQTGQAAQPRQSLPGAQPGSQSGSGGTGSGGQ